MSVVDNLIFLMNENINENSIGFKKKKRIIHESNVSNKTIINVDIQPEYEKFIPFLGEWVSFINENSNNNRIVFLYNGADTLGMISESEYISWLFDLGIDEEVIDTATFYDKGYAFFRYCMDSGIDEENISDLVKFMLKHNINDSREIDSDMWDEFMNETGNSKEDVRELLEFADDMISIPDLMDFLNSYNNIVLLGGGINECLKEVEIALLALDQKYNIMSKFTY